MFCPYCHSEIPDNLIFCPDCNERLPEQTHKRGWRGRDRDSRVRRLIGWGIAAAVLLVVTGGSLPMMLRPKGNVQPVPSDTRKPVVTAQPGKATVKPFETADSLPAGLTRRLNTVDEAYKLMEWMEDTYTLEVELEGLNLNTEQMGTAMNRLPAVAIDAMSQNLLRIRLNPGVNIASAIRNGKEHLLSAEDAAIAQKARQIVSQVVTPGMTDLEKEFAIHDYIIYHCDYEINPALQTEDARGFFNHGRAQCSGYSDTFRLLGSLCGLEIRAVAGDIVGETGGHEWNLIRLDGLWYGVDCTWDDPLGGGQENHLFLNFPHHLLDSDHIYDRAMLPDGAYCQNMDGNYAPIVKGLAARSYAELDQLIRNQLAVTKDVRVYMLGGEVDIHSIVTKYVAPRGGKYPYQVWTSEGDLNVVKYAIKVE